MTSFRLDGHWQGCGAVKIFDGSGSGSGSKKAFRLRLRLRLQAKRLDGSGSGSGSGQNVPAPSAPAPAPAPHILNIDPLRSIKFDPLQKKIQSITQKWFYVYTCILIK